MMGNWLLASCSLLDNSSIALSYWLGMIHLTFSILNFLGRVSLKEKHFNTECFSGMYVSMEANFFKLLFRCLF